MALAALSRGRSSLEFKGKQRSVTVFCDLLAELGIGTEWDGDLLRVFGGGLGQITSSERSLDLRGDAHVAALALGLLVSRPTPSEILVDQVVCDLLVPALAQAHAITCDSLDGGGSRLVLHPPTTGERPRGLSVGTSGVFAWVKEAILLAGLRAGTPTILEERLASADHLERAMTRSKMPLQAEGTALTLHPPRDEDSIAPQIYESIGSMTLAAPVAAAVALVPQSRLTLREIGMNPTRSDVLSVLKLFGARIGVSPRGDRQGEPYGDLFVEAGSLSKVQIGGETALRLGDSAFPLMALASQAEGTSVFADVVPHARGADPKIFGRVVGLLRNAGVEASADGPTVTVVGRGRRPLAPLRVTTGGDSRLALLATILALGASEASIIDDVDCIGQDFPRWAGTLRALSARISVKTSDQ